MGWDGGPNAAAFRHLVSDVVDSRPSLNQRKGKQHAVEGEAPSESAKRDVAPQTEQPTPPPKPLTVAPSPEAGAPLTLAEGASQTFSLKLVEPVSQPLRYTWFLDGKKQAQTQTQDWI